MTSQRYLSILPPVLCLFLHDALSTLNKCRENEVYSWFELPTQTCRNINIPAAKFIFKPGCYCRFGFYMDPERKSCVTYTSCEPPVASALIISDGNSGSSNPNSTTATFRPLFEVLTSTASPNEISGCREHEEFMCGCRITCRMRKDGEKCVSCQEGCYCELGYVYDERLKTCMPESSCVTTLFTPANSNTPEISKKNQSPFRWIK